MMDDAKLMPLEGHLADLRRVLIISLSTFLISSLVIYLGCKDVLFQFLTNTMRELELPLIFISVPEAFLTKIKICLFSGFVLTLPIILWQFCSFIFPAIVRKTRKNVVAIVFLAYLLFMVGIGFGYTVVARFAIFFFLNSAGELSALVTIGKYVDFLVSLVLPFGFVFQLPLVILGLTRIGITSTQTLCAKRKYIYFVILIFAAVITPPDIISQVLLALPVIILFEVSLGVAYLFTKSKNNLQEGGIL